MKGMADGFNTIIKALIQAMRNSFYQLLINE